MIDETAELFKGELGDLTILEGMSLKELRKRRDIRIDRKLRMQKEQERQQKEIEKKHKNGR